jgi:hypothetical protein
MTINRRGTSIVINNPQSRILDSSSPSLLQDITALHQEILGSSVKVEANAAKNTPAMPATPGKVAKTKGSANINWKK